MRSIVERIAAVCIVVFMLISCVPVSALQAENENIRSTETEYTKDAMTAEADAFWNGLEQKEIKLKAEKDDKASYMKAIAKTVKKQDNVTWLKWTDADTFSFGLSTGITCVYDYDMAMASLNSSDEKTGSVEVFDYSTKTTATHSKEVVVFGPYYGEDASFTDYYKNLGQSIAAEMGTTCTVYSGSESTPQAVKNSLANENAVVVIDTHGITTYGTQTYRSSYVGVTGSTGLTSQDLSLGTAVAMSGGHYAIDGYCMVQYGATPLSDCLVWIAACESMMTNGLGYPLIYCGAEAVLGYSQSVSFSYDYDLSGEFWDQMFNKKTVQEAALAAKQVAGDKDPYSNPPAYPVFMWKNDGETDTAYHYPANPDAIQTVESQWKLFNDLEEYTVTFKDWDGTLLGEIKAWQGETLNITLNKEREGYDFIGWDKDLTNIQSDITTTAQYQIKTYTVTFKDWDGSVLSTQTVEHGSSAVAPADPTRTDYIFTGWSEDFSNITSDIEVTALYRNAICTVTFKDWDGTVLKTQKVNYGEAAQAPESPTRTGYTFRGWSTDFAAVTSDLVVWAEYDAITFTVTFKSWNGTVLKTQTVNYGTDATAPTAPERTGYYFKGWDKNYTDVTENLTVTALYNIKTYTVSFVDWNGVTLKQETVNHGSSATPPADPTRAGYEFTGWSASYTNVTSSLVINALYEEVSDPQFTVSGAKGRAGNQVAVEISISNNPGITGNTGFTISYDSAILELVRVENGSVLGGFAQNGAQITWTSGSGNGVVLTAIFTIKTGTATGTETTVSLTGAQCNGNSAASVSGTVIVNNFMLGDANNDGLVNTGDALIILRYLAERITADRLDMTAADVDGSGRVTTADAMYIMRAIAGLENNYNLEV